MMMPRQRTMTQQSTPTQQGVALDLHELASKKPANASTHRAGNSRIITADADRGGLLQRSVAAASAAAELLFVVSVALAIGALAGDNGRRARSTRHVARAGPARRSERRDARSARTVAACHARTTAILTVLLAMVARGMAAHAPVNAVIAPRGAAARALTTTRELSSGDCSSTCYSFSCDDWSNTCSELENQYGCDCDGCSKCAPTVTPTPAPTTAAPTTCWPSFQCTVSTFDELKAAIAVDGASIDVTADIAVTSMLTVSGSVSIWSSSGKTLTGGGSNRLFFVNSGASLALSSLTLSDGYVSVRVRFVIACFT